MGRIILDWGELPERESFLKHCAEEAPEEEREHRNDTAWFPEDGFSMVLCKEDEVVVTRAVNRGIDSHLEAMAFDQFPATHGRIGICIKDAGSLHTLLRRLVEQNADEETALEAAGKEGSGVSGRLADDILGLLGYEWI